MTKIKRLKVIILTAVILSCCNFIKAQTLEVGTYEPGAFSATTLITTGLGLDKGKVWVWGFRGSGQQGNGVHSVLPNVPADYVKSLDNIVDVQAGAYHILALRGDGNLYGWGQNGYGEVGCGGNYVLTPCLVLKDVVQMAVGEYHSIALDKYGNVYTWGYGTLGRLGHGNESNVRSPKKVNLGGEKAKMIGGAYEGSFAVTYDGNVWVWGDNEYNGLGVDIRKHRFIYYPMISTNVSKYGKEITKIGGGNGWGEALLTNGDVIGWGWHRSIGLNNSHYDSADVYKIPVPEKVDHLYMRYVGSVALTENNNIYTWGQTDGSAFPMIYGKVPTKRYTPEGKTVMRIGGGKEHIVYQLDDGSVWGVGYNDLNKLDTNSCCGIIKTWPGVNLRLKLK